VYVSKDSLTVNDTVRRVYHVTGLDKDTVRLGQFLDVAGYSWRVRLLSELDNFVTAIELERNV
jgi:hypothetical protein